MTDFEDGVDVFRVESTFADLVFSTQTFASFDNDANGRLDANDDHADVETASLDGELAASLILDIGAQFGLKRQTVTFWGVTEIDGIA